MRSKLKIKPSSIQSFLVLFSCCGIDYINSFVPSISRILFLLRIILLGVLLVYKVQNKRRDSYEMKIINLFCTYIILVSIVNKEDILYVLRSLSVPYLMAFYIDLQINEKKVFRIINTWKNFLFIFIIIDLFTMILFPNGLYSTEIYSLNWFLGYKTARFPFVLLLCVLEEIVARNKKDFFEANVIYLLSFIAMMKSRATAALLCYCFMAIILIVSRQQYKKQKWKQKVLGAILDYKWIIPLYAVITFLTVVANESSVISEFLQAIGKDPTLTTRTYIWANAIKFIKAKFAFGYGYLTPDQYREMLGSVFFSSPHNMVLSLLMIGGVLCLILYLLLIIGNWKKSKVSQVGFICTIGMLAMLFVGITSSSMIFTLSGFVLFVLSSNGKLIDKIDCSKSLYKIKL